MVDAITFVHDPIAVIPTVSLTTEIYKIRFGEEKKNDSNDSIIVRETLSKSILNYKCDLASRKFSKHTLSWRIFRCITIFRVVVEFPLPA